MSAISRGLVLFLVASITAGCQTTSLERELSYNQNKLRAAEEQRDRLEYQLATCENQQQQSVSELVALQKRFADLSAKNAKLMAEIDLFNSQPIPASVTFDDVIEPDLGSFAGIDGLAATSDGGKVTLTLDQQVLFNSGSADISKRGQQALTAMATVLKDQFAGKEIRVEGHTDNTPIVKTKGRWASNWELSTTRACSVLRKLLAANVSDESNISAVGFGSTRPVSSNSDKKGRSQNRRVEVIVLP